MSIDILQDFCRDGGTWDELVEVIIESFEHNGDEQKRIHSCVKLMDLGPGEIQNYRDKIIGLVLGMSKDELKECEDVSVIQSDLQEVILRDWYGREYWEYVANNPLTNPFENELTVEDVLNIGENRFGTKKYERRRDSWILKDPMAPD
tara:strand:- start:97 stop:540 length:444 start_codon:yes stop_codon:yes gene_type:complete